MKIFSAAATNRARVASRLSPRVNRRGLFIYSTVSRYRYECKRSALLGIVAQPVQELGEAPLGGVDAAAPEIVVVDGFETRIHRDHGGELPQRWSGGVQGKGPDHSVRPVRSEAYFRDEGRARGNAVANACVHLGTLFVAAGSEVRPPNTGRSTG